MDKKQFVVLFIFGCFFIGNVNAIPVTINANDYRAGTDISNAIDGVNIQNIHHANGADSVTYAPAVVDVTGAACHVNGIICERNYLSVSWDGLARWWQKLYWQNMPLSSTGEFIGLSVYSEVSIKSFEFTAFSNHGDGLVGLLYDIDENYMGWFFSNLMVDPSSPYCDSVSPPYCYEYNFNINFSDGFVDYTGVGGLGDINLTSTVHRIVMSSYESIIYFDSVTVDVPEPSSFALLGLGLVGLGFARRKKAA